jgi:actin-related protein
MYCGDETGSFIGEIGSHSCRFGYGGEDNPKFVTASYVASKGTMATSAVSAKLADQDIESILRCPDYSSTLTDPGAFLRQGDIVEHWDHLESAWETAMETLRVKDTMKHTKGGAPYSKTDTADGKCVHPFLAITPGFTQYDGYGASYCATVKREQQIKYTEFLMETMEASSMFLAPAPMLSAFSTGRQTALVVDIGAGGTRVTPVVDGLLLAQSQRRSGRGGDWLGHVTWRALLEEKISPKPRYLLRQGAQQAKSTLFHTWGMRELMYELRTEPFVRLETKGGRRAPFTEKGTIDQEMEDIDPSQSPPLPPGSVTSGMTEIPPALYTFPDGTSIDVANTTLGKDLTYIPELFFANKLPFLDSSSSPNVSASATSSSPLKTLMDAPLHELVHQSLLSVGDVDIRKELTSNILLTGGSSLFPNLDARLSQELSQILPAFTKPKVVAPRFSVERSCSSWIGGSILTSLGSFQQLWLSRKEYEEYGSTMSIQRFP